MMQLLVAIGCLALATATSATTNYESNNEQFDTAPQVTNNDLALVGGAQLNELNLPSYQADRIRSAMAKFFVTPNGVRFGTNQGPLHPELRIRTRSAPASAPNFQDISQLLSSLGVEHEKEQRSVHQQPQQQASPGGHKSLRNIQSVFMRLPPRFGKRALP